MKKLAFMLFIISGAAYGVTADQFVGTGSVTGVVDLGTAEVAGVLPAASVGVGLTNTQVQDALTISGGNVDNTPVGFYTRSTGAFTTLSTTGLLTTAASTATSAGLKLTQGVAPTTPDNGYVWITPTGMYCRAGGITHGPFMSTSASVDFSLADNIDLVFGTDSDYLVSFDGTHLLLQDVDGNELATWTDAGTTGNFVATGNVTASGDLYVNGGDIITDDATVNVLNATATKLNIGGVAAVDLSGAGLATTVKGTFNVDQAVTLDTTLGVTGNTILTGDLAVNGADVTSSALTVNLFNATTTKINLGGAAAVDIGKTGLVATFKGTANFDEAVTMDTTLGVTGDTALAGDLAVNGADITSAAATVNLFNAGVTKLNVGGAAAVDLSGAGLAATVKGTLNVDQGATFDTTLGVTGDTVLTGDLAVNGADVTSSAATVNLFNATTTKINLGGAAAVDIGKTGLVATFKGTANFDEAVTVDTTLGVTGNTTLTGDIAVNGADVTSTALTVQLFDTTTTKINLGGAAAIDIGASGLDLAVKGTMSVAEAAMFTSTIGVTGYKWSASGGDLVWTDGTNTMMSVSDAGTTGDLAVTGGFSGVAGTFTGLVTTPASIAGGAGLIIPPGVAPTAPNNGNVWSTAAGFYGHAGGSTVGPWISATSLTRANMTQQDLQVYPITIAMCRVWDNLASLLPTTAATDDLGIVEGTWLTDDAVIQTSDATLTTTTQRLRFQYPLPVEYVAGETVTFRINAGMITTVSDNSAMLSVEAIEIGTPASNICPTGAQSINLLTPANYDFTITPTGLAPGNVLDVRVTIQIVDGVGGTAVIGQINSKSLLIDVKG